MQEVRLFHEILFLPLRLFPGHGGLEGVAKTLKAAKRNDAHIWEEEDWFLRRDQRCTRASQELERVYAEFLYFHPFVQKLFRPTGQQPQSSRPPVRVFRCIDVYGLELTYRFWYSKTESVKQCKRQLAVERLHLYLFEPEHAVLMLEVSNRKPVETPDVTQNAEGEQRDRLDLCIVMELLDRLRRLYPPYYDFRNRTFVEARVADELEWLGSDSKPLPGQNAKRGDLEKHIDFVKKTRTSPLDPHWAWLLDPLEPIGNASAKGIAFEQFGDDRMPGMAYVAVDKPRSITRGDFVRLAFFDDPGDPNAFPDAPGFHDNFEAKHCYDRYWHPVNDRKHRWCTTRYMFCDYAFSLVGDANDCNFFTNKQSGALAHFRHHYATMGLLLHYQKAALLTFYDRLAGAVSVHGTPDQDEIQRIPPRFPTVHPALLVRRPHQPDARARAFGFVAPTHEAARTLSAGA